MHFKSEYYQVPQCLSAFSMQLSILRDPYQRLETFDSLRHPEMPPDIPSLYKMFVNNYLCKKKFADEIRRTGNRCTP